MKRKMFLVLLVLLLAINPMGLLVLHAEETENDAELIDGLFYEEGLPIVPEKGDYTFSIFVDNSNETDEFWMLDELEEQTNIQVELRRYPYETAQERLNLDLNTGEYADLVGGWTLNDSMVLNYGVQQQIFIPLSDLFAEWAPRIDEVLDLPGVREKMTAPDGDIYAIPYAVSDTTVGYSPYINGRWLENVGMEMPTTTDEFADVLRAFKAEDANGDGDPNNEIPFSTDPNNKSIEFMTGWLGLPMNGSGIGILDDKVVYAGTSSTYREFLSWFNGLYEEGLIDVELYTQDSSTWEGKGNNDLYGVSIAYGSSEFSGITQTSEKSEFDVLPVLNTDDGGTWLRSTEGFNVYRTQAVITDKAEHPEIIARWYDNVFRLENGIGINRGPIGTVVFEEEDGYRAIDNSTLDEETQEKVSWGNLFPQELPKYLPADFEFIEDNPVYNEKKHMEEVYEPYLTDKVVPSFWVDLDKIDLYSDIDTAIIDFFRQQQALFVVGELDVNDDAAWDNYVEGLINLGLEDWCEIRKVDEILY